MSDVKETVKEKYAEAALKVMDGQKGSCGPSGACGCDPITENLYEASQTTGLPEGAVLASLGCDDVILVGSTPIHLARRLLCLPPGPDWR